MPHHAVMESPFTTSGGIEAAIPPFTVPVPDTDLRNNIEWPALQQGMCGSCYTYAAAAALESRAWRQANSTLYPHVSENELTVCASLNIR